MPPGDPSGAGTCCQWPAENSLIIRALCAKASGFAQSVTAHTARISESSFGEEMLLHPDSARAWKSTQKKQPDT